MSDNLSFDLVSAGIAKAKELGGEYREAINGTVYVFSPNGDFGPTETGLTTIPDSGGLIDIGQLIDQKVAHNFDGGPIEQWRLESLATGPNAINDDGRFGLPIQVVYYYMHLVQLEGDTSGEVVDAFRTVLIDEDKKAYAFVSAGVAQDIARIARAFGNKPFSPPVALQATRGKTNRGRQIIRLTPADEIVS